MQGYLMNFENHQLNVMAQKSLCWTMESPAASFQGGKERVHL